jgi:MoxR-like ATPase
MGEETRAVRVCGPEQLVEAQALVRRIPVGEKVMEAILKLVRAARPDSDKAGNAETGLEPGAISWGPGPRASQALMLAVRARALLDGRFAPSTDDVAALAAPVLRHRMALSFTARAEGLTTAAVIERLSQKIL